MIKALCTAGSNPDENSENIFCLLAPRVGRVSFSFDCFAHFAMFKSCLIVNIRSRDC